MRTTLSLNVKNTSLLLSTYTTIAFHIPAFKAVVANTEGNWNGTLILASTAVLLFTTNYTLYYLLLWLGRIAGKAIITFTLVANAISLYFINTYEILITRAMMGNVFNTRFSESAGFFSLSAVQYILF